jgi:hypothetical protein
MDLVQRLRIIGDAFSWQRTNTAQAKSAAPAILEAAAEIERLHAAIARACAGYPADDTAPTCVAILRESLKPSAACQA